MPPAKKKQKTVQPITISDIRVAVIKKKLKAGVKEKDRAFSDFTVRYALVLANKCCHGSSRIMVSSNNTLWDEDAEGGEKDQAKEMQKLVAAALDRHKSAAADREKDCALDVEFGSGALPAADSTTWDYLWGYAENEMRKQLTVVQGYSDASKQGHQTREDKILAKTWEEGARLQQKQYRYKARKATMKSLILASGKSIAQAIDILQYLASRVRHAAEKVGVEFDGFGVVAPKEAKEHKVLGDMLGRAKTCIAGMKKRINKDKLQILTATVALFALPAASGSFRRSCSLIGLNPNAKYVKCGLENREAFDSFLQLEGDIKLGEKVVCRSGFGVLREQSENSLTICLEPWDHDKVYNPPQKARMARWEPSLDEYHREERSDTTPKEWIDAIDKFHRTHNHTSPNLAPAQRRHPQFPTQIEKKPRIFR